MGRSSVAWMAAVGCIAVMIQQPALAANIKVTPLGGQEKQDPKKCLKVLCMVRFVNPSRDIRCAGGREVVLKSLQPLVLYPCNSIFTNGYLTTGGNTEDADAAMIRDLGFEIYRE